MYFFNYRDELYHYGKKGMKWGKHKSKQDYASQRSGNENVSQRGKDQDKYGKTQRGSNSKSGKQVMRRPDGPKALQKKPTSSKGSPKKTMNRVKQYKLVTRKN